MPDSYSLLVKPASFHCNLRCRYCFYLPKEELFGAGAHRMSGETLAAMTRRYLAEPMPVHSFGWQGGEPTTMGTDFFREAVRLQRRHLRGGRVENALQTNGTLLDDDWARLLREERFLVGISVDGPAPLHDRFRLRADGAGTHADVLRGLAALRRREVDVNVLTLVTAANQDHPEDVYRYLRDDLGFVFHQYIECVEFEPDGTRRPYAVQPGKWGEFLCRLFDVWYPSDVRRVSIRLFDSILSRLATGVPTICPMGGNCRPYLVVEHNGDVYPCDFHVQQGLRLGNVRDTPFAAIRALPAYHAFGDRKDPKSAKCSVCRYLPLCMGDCPKNRHAGGSALCEDWRMFYDHTIERFEALAGELCAGAR